MKMQHLFFIVHIYIHLYITESMQTVIIKEGRSRFGRNGRIYRLLQRKKEIQMTGGGSSPKDLTQTEQKVSYFAFKRYICM